MRRLWLFRSDIKHLEYYHSYLKLDEFEKKCHDYYMLLPLWLLQNDYFDEVTIWRLTDKVRKPIIFDINKKKYIQRWVYNFRETFDYPKPDISFFRGGFKEYDNVTKIKPKHFGLKLYLGAGRRQYSQYGGKYDAYLMEDERDFNPNYKCIPFYKTASSYIFHPIKNKEKDIHWDLCWPCNFTQMKYKGQKYFMDKIAKEVMLRRLKIVHCGNKPEVGRKIAQEYDITNIEFLGPLTRPQLNVILNSSRFGLVLSNQRDGCPRVLTEILMSGTPLILRDTVRLMDYYKQEGQGVINTNDKKLTKNVVNAMINYTNHKSSVLRAIETNLSFDNTNKKNINEWEKI